MIRPLHDWILVRLDPFKTERNGLWVSEDSQKVRTATVIRSGPGKPTGASGHVPTGVQEGDRVAFFRWHQEHQQGKQLKGVLSELGDNIGLVRAPDILCAWPPGQEVTVE